MSAIVARGLTKIYKRQIGKPAGVSLSDLHLNVGENEVFGFLGRNGAGKTTTIKLFCSLLRPTRGEAFILGKKVSEIDARRFVGYLPENPYYYEYLTPRETLDFYGRLNGLSAAARAREWDTLADLVDLREIADQRIREFSKGMRQRLAFAVALAGDPQVLILDEPMSGLDPMGRRATRELILKMRDAKKTIFFSSHILSDVEQICDRVGILVKGRLTAQGRLDQLLTGKIDLVEVITAGLSADAAADIAARAAATRRSEAGDHFTAPDIEAANELVRLVQSRGGKLVEFTPVKESLEDLFVRKQEAAS